MEIEQMNKAEIFIRDSAVSSSEAVADVESSGSAVSWGAIIAGAVASSALSLALLMVGAGIGLGSVSPWSANMSLTTFSVLTAAWFIAIQLFSSGLGGYLAGRLRTRWSAVHTDEVYFRDTAHGLLVWAVGAVISALMLSSAISSLASGAAQVGGGAAQAVGKMASAVVAPVANSGDASAYYTDMLFRTDHPQGDASSSAPAEVGRILAKDAAAGDMPDADKTYVSHLIAARTGLSDADAQKRLNDVVDQAKAAKQKAAEVAMKAADEAREVGVYVSLWAFVALLVGAVSASYMATVGGRERDGVA